MLSGMTLFLTVLSAANHIRSANAYTISPDGTKWKVAGDSSKLCCVLEDDTYADVPGNNTEVQLVRNAVVIRNVTLKTYPSEALCHTVVFSASQGRGSYFCRTIPSPVPARPADYYTADVYETIKNLEIQTVVIDSSGTAMIFCPLITTSPVALRWTKSSGRIFRALPTRSNSSSLVLLNASADDSGTYNCGAADRKIDIAEATVSVDVVAMPKVLLDCTYIHQRTLEGTAVQLPCPASGEPKPTASWSRQMIGQAPELLIPASDGYSVDSTTGALSISFAQKTDQGNYTCTQSNKVGSANVTFFLRVVTKPSVTLTIDDSVIQAGEFAQVTCLASEEEVVLRLLKNGKEIATASPDNLTLVFSIPAANGTDTGTYSCNVENEAGNASHSAHLLVISNATFLQPYQEPVLMWEDRNVTLECHTESSPGVNHTWWKWNPYSAVWEPVGSSSIAHINDSSSVLTLPPANDTLGTYRCLATNDFGHWHMNVSVEKRTLALDFSIGKVMLSGFGNAPVDELDVRYRTSADQAWENASTQIWRKGSNLTIRGLEIGKTYEALFGARDASGTSKPNKVLIISTSFKIPPDVSAAVSGAIPGSSAPSRQDTVKQQSEKPFGASLATADPVPSVTSPILGSEKVPADQTSQPVDLNHAGGNEPSSKQRNSPKETLSSENLTEAGRSEALKQQSSETAPTLSTANIIGIVVGSILGVALIIDLALYLTLRRGGIATVLAVMREVNLAGKEVVILTPAHQSF